MNKEEILGKLDLEGHKGDYVLKTTAKYVRLLVDASLLASGLYKTYKTSWISDINESSDSMEGGFEGKEFHIKFKGLFSKPIYTLQVRRDTQYVDFSKQEIHLKNGSEIKDRDLTEIISSTLNEFGFVLK